MLAQNNTPRVPDRMLVIVGHGETGGPMVISDRQRRCSVGALLYISSFLHPRHYTVLCIMQSIWFFAISAKDVQSSGPC